MSHGTLQMQDYPLDVGMHSIVGKAGFDLYSPDFNLKRNASLFLTAR
jgi:hypothetical protein